MQNWKLENLLYSDVKLSISRFLLISTSRPKWCRKSAPTMALVTSATTKIHFRGRRRPKSKVTNCCPYVLIEDPLAANNLYGVAVLLCCLNEIGRTEISAPVSTRYCVLLILSVMKRRRLVWSLSLAVISDRPTCFPDFCSCTDIHTSVLCRRIFYATNKRRCHFGANEIRYVNGSSTGHDIDSMSGLWNLI